MPEGGAPPHLGIRAKTSEEGAKYSVVSRVETLACEQDQRPLLAKRLGEDFKGVG